MNKHSLKVDWASFKAAEYACKNWHYSKSIPVSKTLKIGVWENNQYIGAVIFSRGANRNIAAPYGLRITECCELTRVALTKHKTPVSRIIKIAIFFLKKNSPGIKLIVSYADTGHGHHGGIYQAGNWIFVGSIKEKSIAKYKGRIAHKRTFDSTGIKGYERLPSMDKHKYLYPLDENLRKKLLPLAKPYPKRPKQAMAGSTGTAAV